MDNSTMVASGSNKAAINVERAPVFDSERIGQLKAQNHDRMGCTNSKKAHHTHEWFWKLSGKPPN